MTILVNYYFQLRKKIILLYYINEVHRKRFNHDVSHHSP